MTDGARAEAQGQNLIRLGYTCDESGSGPSDKYGIKAPHFRRANLNSTTHIMNLAWTMQVTNMILEMNASTLQEHPHG